MIAGAAMMSTLRPTSTSQGPVHPRVPMRARSVSTCLELRSEKAEETETWLRTGTSSVWVLMGASRLYEHYSIPANHRMLQELLVVVIGIIHSVMGAAALFPSQCRPRYKQRGKMKDSGFMPAPRPGMRQLRSHLFERLDGLLHSQARPHDTNFTPHQILNLPD